MNLGLTYKEHRRAAKLAKRQFFSHAKATKNAAARGSCTLAVTSLVETAAWHGVAVAEFLDQGKKKGARNFGPTSKPLRAAMKTVQKACACKRRPAK